MSHNFSANAQTFRPSSYYYRPATDNSLGLQPDKASKEAGSPYYALETPTFIPPSPEVPEHIGREYAQFVARSMPQPVNPPPNALESLFSHGSIWDADSTSATHIRNQSEVDCVLGFLNELTVLQESTVL